MAESRSRNNIFVTGFSGTGKTTTGKEAARLLGWRFVDTDDEIESTAGKAIETIFAQDGESAFRKLESETLARIAHGSRQVISTGGGIIMDEANRRVMEFNGVVVLLEGRPETILRRLEQQQTEESDGITTRPMLHSEDALNRIRSLKEQRQFNYTLAHWTVHTDHLTPQEAASEVVRGWKLASSRIPEPAQTDTNSDLAAEVRTSSGDYPLWVGWGIMDELGQRIKRALDPPVAYIISDGGVYLPAHRAQVAMEAVGIPTHQFFIPPGEQSKTLQTAQHIYTWLAEHKAERGHLIVAVGGGVVGDLAGFVAATYLRGMPFAQVPTSLLAMMDAAIGGKTAVDLPQGLLTADPDKLLLQIRDVLTSQHGPGFHYYQQPLRSQWQGGDPPTKTGDWETFLDWARRIQESEEFEQQEVEYKKLIATKIQRARDLVLDEAADWFGALKTAFGPPNN
ncbi:MAG: AAA family ATPase, partial [Chloroflexi bacterium]|nr:AAA family ATPase [Chloroflexota bacterium]